MLKKFLYKNKLFFKNKIEVELDLSYYATKSDLKNATVVDISQLSVKVNLANLKSEFEIRYW